MMSHVAGSRRPVFRAAALLAGMALALTACMPAGPGAGSGGTGGKSGDAGTPPKVERAVADADTTWDVSLQDDARLIGFDAAAELIEADAEAGTWVFPTSVAKNFDLSPGATMLVAGIGLGTITGVSEDGDTTTVSTSQASLADVIEDGEVGWDATLNMGEKWLDDAVTASASGGVGHIDTAAAASGVPQLASISVVGADGSITPAGFDIVDGGFKWSHSADGNDYVFQLKAKGDSAEVTVQVTRKTGSRTSMAYTAKGTLEAVKATGHAEYSGGELVSADVGQKNLKGTLELSIAAAGSGVSDINLTVPGLMFEWVVFVGPVPVTFGVSAQIIGSVTAPEEASATFTSKYTYDGSTGVSMREKEVTLDAGDFGSMTFTPGAADSGAFIGVPVDAQFGVAFPRLSVSVFGQGLVPFIEPGFILGTNLAWGPVCKSAYVRAVVVVGYDFTVLGRSLASDKHTEVINERKTSQDGCAAKHGG